MFSFHPWSCQWWGHSTCFLWFQRSTCRYFNRDVGEKCIGISKTTIRHCEFLYLQQLILGGDVEILISLSIRFHHIWFHYLLGVIFSLFLIQFSRVSLQSFIVDVFNVFYLTILNIEKRNICSTIHVHSLSQKHKSPFQAIHKMMQVIFLFYLCNCQVFSKV